MLKRTDEGPSVDTVDGGVFGWRRARGEAALSDVHRTIKVDGHQRAPARGLPGARLSRRRRLHGPGQLGHLARRRLQVRLHAAGRRARLQHHGDRAAGAVRASRHRLGPRPGAGLPRRLSALGRLSAVGRRRDRHHRHRHRRGDRHRHRAQPAVQHSPRDRRAADRARRVPDPLPAADGLSLSRGADHHAARRHRRLLCRADRAGQPGMGAADPRLRADDRDRHAIRTCCIWRWASSAPR